ncbi:hypothetical protein PGT21_014472 [Puccinia graminis f. sp. tritici]|uniref:alpha-galactosidase n=1 Tax=Puccinia graminis f. sp. tritici TaxID=56615 RepID=A0A5B0Q2X4_PUCGR|nr:hypothetical protein PGT21_014472 [Puccinia graminis f. sp. tritici]KAA1124738.1 hypothetical protein PGTUg99_033288 [Puccinia graminis f. sp. tritici]
MSNLANHQRFNTVRWVGIVTVAISVIIGPTAQNPVELVARNEVATTSPKPPMGWNSDFALDCHYELRDDDFTWQANQLAERGFNAAGYKTFVFDCGWEASSKDGTPGVSSSAHIQF